MEKKDARDNLTESYAEMNRLRIEEKKKQFETELQRYRQDCRKRALDLGYQQVGANRLSIEMNTGDVLAAAEIYYSWLIIEFK